MAKKKEIFNDIEEARAYLEEAPELLEKAKKGKKIAKVQFILMLIVLIGMIGGAALISYLPGDDSATMVLKTSILTIPTIFSYGAIVMSIVAYHKGGGFGKYMKTFKEIAKWGWLLIPIFPADIGVAMMAICFGLVLMLYFPIIFISMHVKSIRKNSAAAEDYIRRCTTAVAFA
jgi:hypothetical protein